ncbi:PREDICTED: S-norcoclaurine synthase 1-like [Ipomoea nil]|uniref:S-norcoclaurine synthase 1-like n=1 Tax=Ipomoea nil TaxID=35883 RepID=UPI000901BE22|nr:PREDICTED: S-norcoclaurine synthase 1-like [Ipomoea nil]
MKTQVRNNKDYGGSLPVQNVQELASNNFTHIPQRYIRPEMEQDEVCSDESLQIPVMDLSKLDADDLELAKLHQACKDWGFFQLINHGVGEAIEEMKCVTEEFFKLPLKEKMGCGQLPNTIEGYGQAFVVSEDQKLDWGDMLFILTLPVSGRDMRFWPTNPSSFRPTLDRYSSELQKVAMRLFRFFEINLGIEKGNLTSKFEDGNQGIRMNYYPPCMQAEKVVGLTPHSDATGLTLLVQVNEVQGLQIKKDAKWVPIKPIPGAIIINIGDIMEIMSNGEYRSIEHRAIVSGQKERLSIAAFHSSNIGTDVGPLSDLVKNGTKYKTLSSEEYVRLVVSSKLDGKSLVHHMKIQQ